VVFELHEWQTISMMQHRCHPPQAPPALRDRVRSLAQLGGFFARQGDGEPGIQAIWQGYQRLHEFIYAVESIAPFMPSREMYNGECPALGVRNTVDDKPSL
jgi:hypothetical protein